MGHEPVDPFWYTDDGRPPFTDARVESTLDVGGREVVVLSHGSGVDFEIPAGSPADEAVKSSDIGDLDDYMTQASVYYRIGGWDIQVVGGRGVDLSTVTRFVEAVDMQ